MLQPSMDRRSLSRGMRVFLALIAVLVLAPLAAVRLPAQNVAGKFGGIVSDPSGLPIANATAIIVDQKANSVQMTTTDAEGRYSFVNLPFGEYDFRATKPGFADFRATIDALDPQSTTLNFTMKVASMNDEIDVIAEGGPKEGVSGGVGGGVEGGVGQGVAGGVRGGMVANGPTKTRLKIGGEVQAAKVVEKVQPVYPDKARIAGIEGTVILHAVIGMDGKPLSLKVLNDKVNPELARAAVEAVSKWRYQSTLLNGQPVEVDTTIMVKFSLAK